MDVLVLPLRAIAFQILFLLMAIAIEGTIMQRQLSFVPRLAMQYAAMLNLGIVVFGWFVFFAVEVLLPRPIQNQLIEFIFFNRWTQQTALWGILAGFLTFFMSFFIKAFSLNQLQLATLSPGEREAMRRGGSSSRRPRLNKKKPKDSDSTAAERPSLILIANAMLVANALSYSAILFVLFTRYLVVEAIS
ncbi:MAG: filament integrity protein FraC [Cyanobacteria bacterium J06638_22]